VLIVFGGTIGAALIIYPLGNVLSVASIIKQTFLSKLQKPTDLVPQFLEYAVRVRKEGILSLEAELPNVSDEFLRKGLQLTVDGLEPQAIREILETELFSLEDRPWA
jgi:chemotaxis protein MotA